MQNTMKIYRMKVMSSILAIFHKVSSKVSQNLCGTIECEFSACNATQLFLEFYFCSRLKPRYISGFKFVISGLERFSKEIFSKFLGSFCGKHFEHDSLKFYWNKNFHVFSRFLAARAERWFLSCQKFSSKTSTRPTLKCFHITFSIWPSVEGWWMVQVQHFFSKIPKKEISS